MGLLILLILIAPFALVIGGIALIRSSRPRAPARPLPPAWGGPPQVPPARVVVGEHSPIDPSRPAVTGPRQDRPGRAIGGTVMVVAGVGLGAAIVSALQSLHDGMGGSKGRLLRLRGKSILPARARGDGWHDGAVPRVDHLADIERRVLAEAWRVSAQMEHASIAAFAQLSLHLAALGAPSELVERTHRAALDEIKHARRCFAFARAFGGEAETAGPIAELAQPERGGAPIDLVRLAIGSLVDGCVAEGIAADVAANGARGAADPVIREALAMIAADEQQHAELAWAVLAWCLDRGGLAVRGPVAARIAKLDDELAPRAPDFPGLAPDQLASHGLFDQDTLGAIATARIAATRARATELVGGVARAA
jgi:hypothetical protein